VKKPGRSLGRQATGRLGRGRTEPRDRDTEQVAGPGRPGQIDFPKLTVAGNYDENAFMAFDHNPITKPWEITQRGDR
jgi:hypothetical protein